jgi:glutaredoxin
MDGLTTSQLAKICNVNIETIRYYEKRQLISKPPRTKSGYRLFSHETVLACTQCEVTVYDLNKRSGMKEAEEKAKAYGVKFVPAVAINGKLVDFEIMKKARLGHLSYSD